MLLPLSLLGLAAAQTFSNNVILDPPDNYTDPQVLYARSLQLESGALLATWENYSPEPPPVWFPIVCSDDGGVTWTEIAHVTDEVNGWGLRYQPQLYQLPGPLGEFPAGTVLLAGNSIPTDLSQTKIDVYASLDEGVTWEFVSSVAEGGVALPEHGLTPVWEPHFLLHGGELILYYADQRDNATHSQKLSHQTTCDLLTWSKPVTDVAYAEYTARPGMPVVAQLPTGDFIYTFEYGGEPSSESYWFPVYYRIASDPTAFGEASDHKITAAGVTPTSSPYVVWSAYGGENGTIVVSGGTRDEIFTNQALGDPEAWEMWTVPQPRAYTRSLLVFEEDPDLVLIIGGGHLPPSSTNEVSCSVVRLSEIMA